MNESSTEEMYQEQEIYTHNVLCCRAWLGAHYKFMCAANAVEYCSSGSRQPSRLTAGNEKKEEKITKSIKKEYRRTYVQVEKSAKN